MITVAARKTPSALTPKSFAIIHSSGDGVVQLATAANIKVHGSQSNTSNFLQGRVHMKMHYLPSYAERTERAVFNSDSTNVLPLLKHFTFLSLVPQILQFIS